MLPSEGKLDVGEGMTACEGKGAIVPVPEPEDKALLFAVWTDQDRDEGN